MFVRIPHNASYPGQSSDFCGGALSVASGNDDFSFRILPLHAANGCARILIGRRGDGARIQDDPLGLRDGGSAGKAALVKLAFNRGAVGLSRTATEILHVVAGHESMVAYATTFRSFRAPDLAGTHDCPCRRLTSRPSASKQSGTITRRLPGSAAWSIRDRTRGVPAWDGKEPLFPSRSPSRWPESLPCCSGNFLPSAAHWS